MKIYGRIFTLMVVLPLMASCAAPNPTYDEYASSLSPASAGNGRIYFYRVARVGGTIRPEITIDGEAVGRTIPYGFIYVDRLTGNYQISLSTESHESLSVDVVAGEEIFIRLDIQITPSSWDVNPILVDAATGREQLKDTKYTGE
jgi:hypothetical protein